jgi:hypothetical protein
VVDGHYLVADLSSDGYARLADLNRRFDDLDLGPTLRSSRSPRAWVCRVLPRPTGDTSTR